MTSAVLSLLLALPARSAVINAPAAAAASAGALGAVPLLPVPSIGAQLAPSLPSFLSVENPEDRVMLARIVEAAKASPTAAAVLARVEKAAAVRGRPLVVEVLKMKESGTYNLDWGIISLRRKDLADAPVENVPTIVHEMLHLLQTDELKVPSDLLETELEAYVVDFRVHRELGVTPAPGSYDARAQAAFKRGFEPFMRFLKTEYPEDASFWRTRSKDYESRLRKGLDASVAERAAVAAEREDRRRVLAQMERLGHGESELKTYHADSIAPLDTAIATLDRGIAWALKDLEVFASPETLKKARDYARGVVRKARAYQKRFAAP